MRSVTEAEPQHFAEAEAEIFGPAPALGSKNHTQFYQNRQLFNEKNCMSNLKNNFVYIYLKDLFISNFVF
jgi:hypothetical protein